MLKCFELPAPYCELVLKLSKLTASVSEVFSGICTIILSPISCIEVHVSTLSALLFRLTHVCPTWALCKMPNCPYRGLHWVCPCVSNMATTEKWVAHPKPIWGPSRGPIRNSRQDALPRCFAHMQSPLGPLHMCWLGNRRFQITIGKVRLSPENPSFASALVVTQCAK